jgi:hypothetical protein
MERGLLDLSDPPTGYILPSSGERRIKSFQKQVLIKYTPLITDLLDGAESFLRG